MRSFISLAALCAAFSGYPALAEEQARQASPNAAPPFAEDGVYIAAGETIEVAIAGTCRRLTNQDPKVGFFFSPSQPGSWPATNERDRAPFEPAVTEAPCK